ncbi:tail fiber assembly protein [Yersinia ruckeri]|uniref:tail fiber assembly protein n=1 Tax=Yersinia ruckeri TaxID=29486 RepID=UPI0020BF7522|nr:tail fiber assembly protein [Yersinia ruckeri]MCK8543036.1 tail fiber assembly protein [Yersinia ruckeri]MCW6578372.1 tail fiber assembly protein [Yersinia ruckeri]MCW6587838.1 tail fiber assembly protein [Yersinia ruckeri]
MNAYFSPTQVLFYAANMVDDGSYGNSLPEDLFEPTEEETEKYWRVSPPDGKRLGAAKGRPVWIDLPPLTSEQQKENAETQRTQLRSEADGEIAWRQDAVDTGIATKEEAASLAEWKKYRILLMRVDTSTAPDIEWTLKPE